mgnify:FL=1
MEREEVKKIIEKENIKYLQMQFTDILGSIKTVMIPSFRFDKIMDDGVLFDGSSIVGYATIEESDMRAIPDLSTFQILPWYDDRKTARIICDIATPSGEQFQGDPRYVLKRMLKKAHDKGFQFFVGPEFEFFLFRLNEEGKPIPEPSDRGSYFDFTPIDKAENVKKEILYYLEIMNYNPEASHHEVSPGQHEIDLRYADALTMADRIVTLKSLIKSIAIKYGLFASFMPKPLYGVNGSGMHIHQSLMTADQSKNYFYDADGKYGLSKIAFNYIGGILHHAKEITAILNSSVNSYKRLVPGFEAPVYISWANLNRSALIRIPQGRGLKTRIELRNPDPAGNPYLQFSVILAAGLDGIEKNIMPPEPVEKDIYRLNPKEREELGIENLPGSLGEALNYFKESKLMKETLGEHIFNHFYIVKSKEFDYYRSEVTPWEIQNLLPVL